VTTLDISELQAYHYLTLEQRICLLCECRTSKWRV